MSDPAEREHASRWRRLAASAVDMLLVPILTIVLVMLTDVAEDADDFMDNLWMLHVLLLAIASYLLLNGVGLWRYGQTIGKRLFGIMITNAHGRDLVGKPLPATFWKLICLRALFFPFLFLLIVPWVALVPLLDQLLIFRKNRRCLHDILAGTVVVDC